MNNEHWEKFYKDRKAETLPSQFAIDVIESIYDIVKKEKSTVFDLGSGNGRDSVFFAQKGLNVISVDRNGKPYTGIKTLMHWEVSIDDFLSLEFNDRHSKGTIFYSRFFIHAIKKSQTERFIKRIKPGGHFIAEFRIKGDEPKIYQDHKRFLWDEKEFLKLFDKKEWEVFHTVGRDFAKYKDENPLVMRIAAYKK